jgi:hypothetical protein
MAEMAATVLAVVPVLEDHMQGCKLLHYNILSGLERTSLLRKEFLDMCTCHRLEVLEVLAAMVVTAAMGQESDASNLGSRWEQCR